MQRIEELKRLTARVKENNTLSAELTQSLTDHLLRLTASVMREVMFAGSTRDRQGQPNLLFITDKENDIAPLTQFLAKAYHIAGYLPTDRVTHLRAADLLDATPGATAAKTKETLESAMGGVILIEGIPALPTGDSCAQALMDAFYDVMREHEFERDHLFILTVQEESDLYEHAWITCRFNEILTLGASEDLTPLLP